MFCYCIFQLSHLKASSETLKEQSNETNSKVVSYMQQLQAVRVLRTMPFNMHLIKYKINVILLTVLHTFLTMFILHFPVWPAEFKGLLNLHLFVTI